MRRLGKGPEKKIKASGSMLTPSLVGEKVGARMNDVDFDQPSPVKLFKQSNTVSNEKLGFEEM